MAIKPEILQQLQDDSDLPKIDLSWLNLDTEWGSHADSGRRGLTLDEIATGSYGVAPEEAGGYTGRPRGAAARPVVPALGLRYHGKANTWSDNCTLLYEEALQRQWSSAMDIPWETIEPLPDDLELAMCQLCTFLTEVEFIAGDLPGQWLPTIAPEHFEVALFLATQIQDEARHLDVFRKRALANGCGLLQGNPAGFQGLAATTDFTEMSALLHIVGEGFVQSMFRMGELISSNEAEKRIFRLSAQDESRHVGFGVMHLKHVLDVHPERREEIHSYLDQFELILGSSQVGVTFTPTTTTALSILLGGGRDKIDDGYNKLEAIRKRQVQEYLHRLDVAGMPDRRERLMPGLRPYAN